MSQQQDFPESAKNQFDLVVNSYSSSYEGYENFETALANTLHELQDRGQIFQYSLSVDKKSPWRTDDEANSYGYPYFYLWNELENIVAQVVTEIAKGISENKNTLDILTDLATIFGVALPLARKVLAILRKEKEVDRDKKIPTVRIAVGDASIEVNSSDLKESEASALRLAKRFLKEHPDARVSNKMKISGGIKPAQPKNTKSVPRQSGSRKRSK